MLRRRNCWSSMAASTRSLVLRSMRSWPCCSICKQTKEAINDAIRVAVAMRQAMQVIQPVQAVGTACSRNTAGSGRVRYKPERLCPYHHHWVFQILRQTAHCCSIVVLSPPWCFMLVTLTEGLGCQQRLLAQRSLSAGARSLQPEIYIGQVH